MSSQRSFASEERGADAQTHHSHKRSRDVHDNCDGVAKGKRVYSQERCSLSQRHVDGIDAAPSEEGTEATLDVHEAEEAQGERNAEGALNGAGALACNLADVTEEEKATGTARGDGVEIVVEVSALTPSETEDWATPKMPEAALHPEETASEAPEPFVMAQHTPAVQEETEEAKDVEGHNTDSQKASAVEHSADITEQSSNFSSSSDEEAVGNAAATPTDAAVPHLPSAETLAESRAASVVQVVESTEDAAAGPEDAVVSPTSHTTTVEGEANVSELSEAGTPPPPSQLLSDNVEKEKSVASWRGTPSPPAIETETCCGTDGNSCE